MTRRAARYFAEPIAEPALVAADPAPAPGDAAEPPGAAEPEAEPAGAGEPAPLPGAALPAEPVSEPAGGAAAEPEPVESGKPFAPSGTLKNSQCRRSSSDWALIAQATA